MLKICLIFIYFFAFAFSQVEYTMNQNIIMVNDSSLETLFSSKSSSLILLEFFIPWCGYCISYAPTFIRFAESIRDWNDVVVVGAGSCSDSICRTLRVSKVPSIKIFTPWNRNFSSNLETGSEEKITENLIKEIKKLQKTNKSIEGWPSLQSISLNEIDKNCSNCVFIIENNSSFLAPKIILDFQKYRNKLKIIHVNDSRKEEGIYNLEKNELKKIETLFDRASLKKIINDIIEKNFTNDLTKTPIQNQTENAAIIKGDEEKHETYTYRPAHDLYLRDLIASLSYSLFYEIGSVDEIRGEKKEILKKYIKILIKFFPGGKEIVHYIELISDWLENTEEIITSDDWLDKLEETESENAFIPRDLKWKGCEGSTEDFRGFPCSLWMTFHTLSVQAYLSHSNSTEEGIGVLMAIRGYMKHFFSCSSCSEKFLNATNHWTDRNITSLWKPETPLLELWIKHNKVNKRLHTTSPYNEDPLHPKIQFPAKEDCPLCRKQTSQNFSVFNFDINQWDFDQVVIFLVNYYKEPKINSCSDIGKKPYSTNWSKCSKPCGVGTTHRFLNFNSRCKMELETRLCYITICQTSFPKFPPTFSGIESCKNSGHTYIYTNPFSFSIHNCSSPPISSLNVCGECPSLPEKKVCCIPTEIIEEPLTLTCKHVEKVKESEKNSVYSELKTNILVHNIETILHKVKKCSCGSQYC